MPDSLHTQHLQVATPLQVTEGTATEPLQAVEGVGQGVGYAAPRRKAKTPYEVLSRLPKDATPAQQDSAIQAAFEFQQPNISLRPDTLILPLDSMKYKRTKEGIRLYYKENFFSTSAMYHPEISGGLIGKAGERVPYSFASDNVITAFVVFLLVFCFVALRGAKGFIMRQLRSFVYEPHGTVTEVMETTREVRFQMSLSLMSCVIMGLYAYFYTVEHVAITFTLVSQYQLIGIFALGFLGFHVARYVLQVIFNAAFFPWKPMKRWSKAQLFLTSLEGLLLVPVVVMVAYFKVDTRSTFTYVILVISLVRLMSVYKEYTIFFKHLAFRVQIILYLCALEIVPLGLLFFAVRLIVDYLKINY